MNRSVKLAMILSVICADPVLAGTTLTRTSAFDYDSSTGLLTREIVEPDSSVNCLVSDKLYDDFGNVKSVTQRNCAAVAGTFSGSGANVNTEAAAPSSTSIATISPRTTQTSYGAGGRFPESITNALQQTETRSYDAVLGVLTKLVGPNQQSTQWAYDTFGRKILEQRADGTGTRWSYEYCQTTSYPAGTASCPTVNGVVAVYATTVTPLSGADVSTPLTSGTANGPYVKSYADALNRTIRTETQGYDGTNNSVLIYQDTVYNDKGQITQQSRPYFAGTAIGSIAWIKTQYDQLGRVSQTSQPYDSQTNILTTTTYSGLTTTVTNDKGQQVVTLTDWQGQVISITDNVGKTLNKTWDPFGNLLSTTDSAGNSVLLGYDARGRKTSMVDPDMGSWYYGYNSAGEFVRQLDSKLQLTTLTYDALGRQVSKSEPSLNSTWYYDSYQDGSTCSGGKGRLCEVLSDNGYRRKVAYDSYGRVTGTTETIGSIYTIQQSYTSDGRADVVTYPGNPTPFRLKNVYTALGYLKQVVNADSPSSIYWRADSIDAEGRVTQQTTGNLVTTVRAYDPYTGQLRSIKAGATGGGSYSVQNASYTYDSIGNLTSSAESNTQASATYGYDTLNRLTSEVRLGSALPGAQTLTWGYDAIGNMRGRSDVGVYSYAGTQPHAVSDVIGSLNGVSSLHYDYDQNGNLASISGSGSSTSIDWTSSNKINNVNRTSAGKTNSLAYLYNAEGDRVRESFTQDNTLQRTTIYLNPGATGALFYEEESDYVAKVIRKKFYINAGSSVEGVLTLTGNSWSTQYWHKDNLGSTVAVTDAMGAVVERMSYEPYGKRRNVDASTDLVGVLSVASTRRGYTGHEMMDEVGLVNMNGRVFDPALSRFVSADPLIESPDNMQSYNRYAYVWNNPMNRTDPSGFCFAGCFWHGHRVTQAVNGLVGSVAKPFQRTWSTVYHNEVGRALITIAAAYYTGGWASGYFESGAIGSAIGGAAGGLAGSNGHLQAGVNGAATAVAFYGVGSVTGMHGQPAWKDISAGQYTANVAGHALVGCASAVASGGDCGRGAASAGVAALAAPFLHKGIEGLAESAIIGGTASAIGGGKFSNGAITAGFGYLYNHCGDVEGGCWSALKDAASMTYDWATGGGSNYRVFGPGSIQVIDMMDAPGVNAARDLYYKKYPSINPNGSVTNYGASFGVTGLFDSDGLLRSLSPTRQFVGSYSVNVFTVDQGKTLMFVLNNNSSMKSFMYGVGPAYERSTLGAGGNMRQTYWWTEPRK